MSGIKGMKHKNKGHRYKQEELEVMCCNYLRDNFHKLNEANKIKVSLTIASKMVTQKTETTAEVKYNQDANTGKEILNHINRLNDQINTN